MSSKKKLHSLHIQNRFRFVLKRLRSAPVTNSQHLCLNFSFEQRHDIYIILSNETTKIYNIIHNAYIEFTSCIYTYNYRTVCIYMYTYIYIFVYLTNALLEKNHTSVTYRHLLEKYFLLKNIFSLYRNTKKKR